EKARRIAEWKGANFLQSWIHQTKWRQRFANKCAARRKRILEEFNAWKAQMKIRGKKREAARLYRKFKNLAGQMVSITVSRKDIGRSAKGFDMRLAVYVPATQEQFNFIMPEDVIRATLHKALSTDSVSGAEVSVENIKHLVEKVSCKYVNGKPVIFIARRVAVERGKEVFKTTKRVGPGVYYAYVYKSLEGMTFQLYDPKTCGILRVIIPFTGRRGLRAWLEWHMDDTRRRRRRVLQRRLEHAQKVLSLHEMHVEVDRIRLLAARRLVKAQQGAQELAEKEAELIGDLDEVIGDPVKHAKKDDVRKGSSISRDIHRDDEAEVLNCDGCDETKAAEEQYSSSHLPPALAGMGAPVLKYYDGILADLAELDTENEPLETDALATGLGLTILDKGNEIALARWVLEGLRIDDEKRVRAADIKGIAKRKKDTNDDDNCGDSIVRKSRVYFERVLKTNFDMELAARGKAATCIQGLYAMWRARLRVYDEMKEQWEKRFDIYSNKYYYWCPRTGSTSWLKPKLLGKDDLPDPPNCWDKIVRGDGTCYYINPATGQESNLSEAEAANLIQKAVRRYLGPGFAIPALEEIADGRKFSLEAEEKYTLHPERLSSCLNWAMILFAHHTCLDEAKPLFETAMQLSGENPLVQRCYALFLLASCQFPREKTYKEAKELMKAAAFRDKDMDKFKIAETAFFRYGLLLHPRNGRVLLNWALVLEFVHKDYLHAGEVYRRAVAANDLDVNILTNFNSFLINSLPGGDHPCGGPGASVLARGVVQETRDEWGRWQRMQDPKAKVEELQEFYLDMRSQQVLWRMPDMSLIWGERVK
ncbi:unnamed protein product, partial [Chrysoparadoxa australica]